MKVLSIPHASQLGEHESGIKRVVSAYFRYGREYGIEYVDQAAASFDVVALHAGMASIKGFNAPLVSHLHGLYWSADLPLSTWEWEANAAVVESIRHARILTVPSEWVAETIRRDVRVDPVILPHGIEWEEWQNPNHDLTHQGYVLWNKNRDSDVCDPSALGALALKFPDRSFVTTFGPKNVAAPNIKIIGVVPHDQMKTLVQRAAVYLSTTKETFGVGVLEALASGTPVLGYAWGGNLDLVQHGVSGYLARPNDVADLLEGLAYCVKHRRILSANARELAKKFTWRETMQKLAEVYERAGEPDPPTVSIIIPCYNYGSEEKLGRAIRSALAQTYRVDRVIVVDDGSEDGGAARRITESYGLRDGRTSYFRQNNSGVAVARNYGIEQTQTKYLCALDADDALEPEFIRACVEALEADPALGIAYTGITARLPDGSEQLSEWPGEFDYDQALTRKNQIPTACVFRRVMWERLGGYRQRYAPMGAGAEDGEFWLRAGAYGFNARKVTDAGLFVYSLGAGQVSGNRDYREIDYTQMHPWTKDGFHPLASLATPKKLSHPVRQYDSPSVSVILPVGPGHEKRVIDALDSLESQTFRNWEAIVVWDNPEDWKKILAPYPYVKVVPLMFVTRGFGAGYARNRGAEIARAPLLLFLDADDTLDPHAIREMVTAYNVQKAIIYTDRIGKAFMSYEEATRADSKLLAYLEYKNVSEAVFEGRALPYDQDRAMQQPNPRDMYIWCLITSLVPKKWHNEIGGFDESMSSWEDWDYWLRLARAGKCFTHLPQPLVIYRYYSGSRRENGLQDQQKLIEYLQGKYKGADVVPCNCGSRNTAIFSSAPPNSVAERSLVASSTMSDADMILVLYDSPNKGSHRVVGQATGKDYFYHSGGDRFYMFKQDAALMPNVFIPIILTVEEETDVPKETPAPPLVEGATADDSEGEDVFDLQTIPGVTAEVAVELNALGVHTLEDLARLDLSELTDIKTIGPARAHTILSYAQQKTAA